MLIIFYTLMCTCVENEFDVDMYMWRINNKILMDNIIQITL